MADNCLPEDVNGGRIVPKRRDKANEQLGERYGAEGNYEEMRADVAAWKALAAKAETERDNLREQLDLLPIGCPIGRKDHNGNPVHVGDELEFNEREWGEPMRFIVELKDGLVQHPGGSSDLESWCTITRKWDEVVRSRVFSCAEGK